MNYNSQTDGRPLFNADTKSQRFDMPPVSFLMPALTITCKVRELEATWPVIQQFFKFPNVNEIFQKLKNMKDFLMKYVGPAYDCEMKGIVFPNLKKHNPQDIRGAHAQIIIYYKDQRSERIKRTIWDGHLDE